MIYAHSLISYPKQDDLGIALSIRIKGQNFILRKHFNDIDIMAPHVCYIQEANRKVIPTDYHERL
jgi:hypothetical protein